MAYTIAEASKRSGLSIYTLRYYEKEGLMPYVQRNSAGIRNFKESDFEWLAIINCLKASGVPIKQIREFVGWCMEGDGTLEKRLEFFKNHKKNMERQLEEFNKNMEVINYKLWYYETAVAAGTAAIHDDSKIPHHEDAVAAGTAPIQSKNRKNKKSLVN